jgi:hypothetical protein
MPSNGRPLEEEDNLNEDGLIYNIINELSSDNDRFTAMVTIFYLMHKV